MRRILKIVLLFLMNAGSLQAQKVFAIYKPNPLDSFLRQQADTTLSFRLTTNFNTDIPIHYLSKKGDTVTLYRYGSSFNPYIVMPQAIRKVLFNIHIDRKAFGDTPELSRLFNAIDVPQSELCQLWKNIMTLNPGHMHDDVAEGYGCPVKKEGNTTYDNTIYDGVGIHLAILTKSNVKYFYFNEPEYYEKECPGRKGRKTIVAIQKLLAPYCKFWNR